jgi:hypothetical protein
MEDEEATKKNKKSVLHQIRPRKRREKSDPNKLAPSKKIAPQ